jgi:hypothetical protein
MRPTSAFFELVGPFELRRRQTASRAAIGKVETYRPLGGTFDALSDKKQLQHPAEFFRAGSGCLL